MDRTEQFFSANFLMPHGQCFMWLPEILWVHVAADVMIALAYFSIPLALWHFAKQRPDIPFRRIFILFASFILLCGLTHIFGLIVLWHPIYGIEGLVMLLTGLVSAFTAFYIWRIIPIAVTLPSPAQYQKVNEELKVAYDKIEQVVEKRTQQLKEANEKLLKANQAEKDFVANISHEIRTPMNVIHILAQKMHNGDIPANKKDEAIESLYISSKMLTELISDVLDFSKIEAGSLELAEQEFHLKDIVKSVATIVEIQAQQKGLQFKTEGNYAQMSALKGDPLRLKQILLNLANNAIKFTEEGSVSLTVEGKAKSDSADLTFAVEDTGKGISPDKQQHIFQKFTQEDGQIAQKYGGTGLGLSISKALVEEMGGDIALKSEVNKGTCFTITLQLPLAEEQTVADKPSTKQDKKQAKSTEQLPVLLVEDTPGNILVADIIFEELEYEHLVAKNAKEAISLFDKHRFGLIFMDLRLPDQTGYEITEYIRKTEREKSMPATPIIAMTAFATDEERQKCFDAGMDGFTTKPLEVEKLKELLTQYYQASFD